MKKTLKILISLVLLFFLAGCNNRLLIQDATSKEIIPVFIEYASLHGYKITYRNDATGSYRVELGEVYIPQNIESIKTKVTVATQNIVSTVPLTSYEEQNWKTINSDSRYVTVAVMVRIKQKDNNVIIMVDTDDNIGPTYAQGNNLKRYFEDAGYKVDFI